MPDRRLVFALLCVFARIITGHVYWHALSKKHIGSWGCVSFVYFFGGGRGRGYRRRYSVVWGGGMWPLTYKSLFSWPQKTYISTGKVCIWAKWPISAGAYPGFLIMKRLGVFLLPLRLRAVFHLLLNVKKRARSTSSKQRSHAQRTAGEWWSRDCGQQLTTIAASSLTRC